MAPKNVSMRNSFGSQEHRNFWGDDNVQIASVLRTLMHVFLAAALVVMLTLVFGNVVLRFGFNTGIAVSDDISRFLMICVVLVGAIAGIADRSHLGTDFILAMLPKKIRQLAIILSYPLAVFAFSLLAWGSWQQAKLNAGIYALGALRYPLSWIYYAGAIGGGLCATLVLWKLMSALFSGGITSIKPIAAGGEDQ